MRSLAITPSFEISSDKKEPKEIIEKEKVKVYKGFELRAGILRWVPPCLAGIQALVSVSHLVADHGIKASINLFSSLLMGIGYSILKLLKSKQMIERSS